MTVEGRGLNASVVEKDIGTVNGVIQVMQNAQCNFPNKKVIFFPENY